MNLCISRAETAYPMMYELNKASIHIYQKTKKGFILCIFKILNLPLLRQVLHSSIITFTKKACHIYVSTLVQLTFPPGMTQTFIRCLVYFNAVTMSGTGTIITRFIPPFTPFPSIAQLTFALERLSLHHTLTK